jgi:hypothetical protein
MTSQKSVKPSTEPPLNRLQEVDRLASPIIARGGRKPTNRQLKWLRDIAAKLRRAA